MERRREGERARKTAIKKESYKDRENSVERERERRGGLRGCQNYPIIKNNNCVNAESKLITLRC